MTFFQKKVYKVVKKIPKGKILSYRQVAKLAGEPRAWRAVGNILNKNKDKKIPCHRVTGSDGKVGGYRNGVKKKIQLLKKEGIIITKGKIALPSHQSLVEPLKFQRSKPVGGFASGPRRIH